LTPATADLCDAHPGVQVADPIFLDYGSSEPFHGTIATVKVFEDNAMVRTLLEERGAGRVLIIDGGGSKRCALVGGNLAELAAANDWRGVIVNGCIRDSAEIRTCRVGVKAISTHPRKSEKGLHSGRSNLPVTFAGVTFEPGQWVYADADGIVVSATPLHTAAPR
jgi:regulator of ribonuclease activity A